MPAHAKQYSPAITVLLVTLNYVFTIAAPPIIALYAAARVEPKYMYTAIGGAALAWLAYVTLDSCELKGAGSGPMLGAYFGNWQPSFFNGFIANVGIFSRALAKTDVSCMFKFGETHLGLPTLGGAVFEQITDSGR